MLHVGSVVLPSFSRLFYLFITIKGKEDDLTVFKLRSVNCISCPGQNILRNSFQSKFFLMQIISCKLPEILSTDSGGKCH